MKIPPSSLRRSFARPLLVVLAAGGQVTPAAAQDAALPEPTRWLVAIGVSEHADPSIEGPRFAAADARAFHARLAGNSAAAGIPASRTRLLVDEQATNRSVRSALATFLRQAGPDDIVLVLLAGQAVVDPDRMDHVYFLPYDAERGALPATALDLDQLARSLRDLSARRKVVFADLARTERIKEEGRRGIFPNVVNAALRAMAGSSGAVVVTASEGSQPSLEGEDWGGGHGVFTHVLIEGWGGAADLDEDGVIRLGELAEWARDRVAWETHGAQTLGVSLTTFDGRLPLRHP